MRALRRSVRYVLARPLAADTVLAVLVLVVAYSLIGAAPTPLRPPHLVESLTWSLAGIVPIAIRRTLPWLAVGLMAVHATLVAVVVGVPADSLALLIVTYTIAAHQPVRSSTAATVLMWVPPTVVSIVTQSYVSVQLNLTLLIILNGLSALVAFLTGRIVFTRRRYVAALVERAHAAEQNQQALASQAVDDERRRIARELHDMVAHHVSVMGVLATGSRRMLHKNPAAADEALATIEETGRTVLREMRRLLDVLRTDPEPDDPLAPQPTLAGLDALVEQVRDAGLPVVLRTPYPDPEIAPGVAVTVYRIVQEALTNVIKHAGANASAEVRLDVDRDWLTVEIFDTGHGPVDGAHTGVGHGLLGMRERVALFGGTLRTGPRPGGGYRVYARIPLEEVQP